MSQMTLRTMCDIKTLCYILSETEEGISGRQKSPQVQNAWYLD
jgi:hypothetical protein